MQTTWVNAHSPANRHPRNPLRLKLEAGEQKTVTGGQII